MSCLGDEQIQSLLLGHASEAEAAACSRHLQDCAACSRRAAESDPSEDVSPGGATTATASLDLQRPPSTEGPLGKGALVGRYVVLELLGQGGMGHVYAAYDPELDRKVALKLVSCPEERFRALLLQEARAMARVAHPHVVPVFDAGSVGEHVFVAMELVKGVTLRRWVAEGPRPWLEILGACLEAGRGLAAAHRGSLVHRDFKPDNVLVGEDGRARVTDFGVVHLVDPEAGARRSAVGRGAAGARRVGTVGYMAPEQLLGLPVDARADQFAFAATAYECLTGRRPFLGRSPIVYMQKVSRGLRAPPPEGAPPIPAGLLKTLQRALSLEPRDRFASVDELLSALEAHARRADRRRRAARWALAGLGLLGLAAPAAMALWPDPCPAPLERLQGVWDEGVARQVEESFAASGRPYAALGAREASAALDRYAEAWAAAAVEACRGARAGALPPARAAARFACLDRRHAALRTLSGLLARADAVTVDRAVELASSLGTPAACARDPARAPSGADQAARLRIAEAETLRLAFQLDRAAAVLEQAELALAGAPGPEVEAELLHTRGAILMDRGRHADAGAELARAFNAAISAGDDALAARAASKLAYVEGVQEGRTEDGLRWAELAGAIVRRLGGDEELEADVAAQRANVLGVGARFEEAVAHARRGVALSEALYGPDAMRTLSRRNSLATFLYRSGEVSEGQRQLQQTIDAMERVLGPEHPRTAGTRINFANTFLEQERPVTAERLAREPHRALAASLGPDHPMTLKALGVLSHALCGVPGRSAEGVAMARDLVARLERISSPEAADLLGARRTLAIGLLEIDRPAEALAVTDQALAPAEAVRGARQPWIRGLLRLTRGAALNALGRAAEAEPVLLAARTDLQRVEGERRLELARVEQHLARARLLRGDLAGALAASREGERLLGDAGPEAASARAALRAAAAEALRRSGDLEGALRAAEAAADLASATALLRDGEHGPSNRGADGDDLSSATALLRDGEHGPSNRGADGDDLSSATTLLRDGGGPGASPGDAGQPPPELR